MDDRIQRLERTNRILALVLVGLIAFLLGSSWGSARSPEAPRLFPRAEAGTIEAFKASERPEVIFAPSDSGATLYEYRRQDDGSYVKRIWG